MAQFSRVPPANQPTAIIWTGAVMPLSRCPKRPGGESAGIWLPPREAILLESLPNRSVLEPDDAHPFSDFSNHIARHLAYSGLSLPFLKLHVNGTIGTQQHHGEAIDRFILGQCKVVFGYNGDDDQQDLHKSHVLADA
jgi:hypothetical protein